MPWYIWLYLYFLFSQKMAMVTMMMRRMVWGLGYMTFRHTPMAWSVHVGTKYDNSICRARGAVKMDASPGYATGQSVKGKSSHSLRLRWTDSLIYSASLNLTGFLRLSSSQFSLQPLFWFKNGTIPKYIRPHEKVCERTEAMARLWPVVIWMISHVKLPEAMAIWNTLW